MKREYSPERLRAMQVGRWGSASPEERFWSKVDATGDCWLWTGITRHGYGMHEWQGVASMAHRIAYTLLVGPVPQGLVIDHLCRVKLCVNPVHMEPVTQGENVRRGRAGYHPGPNRGNYKTHCVHGHAYVPENTMYLSGNRRQCRQCHRLNNRTAYLRDKARRAASQHVITLAS